LVVVGGVTALSRVVDPPEEFLKRPRTFDEVKKIEVARDLCGEGARILMTYANEIADLADSVIADEKPERIAKELERIARFIEADFKKLSDRADRVGETMPQVRDAVKSVFPLKLGSDIAWYLKDVVKAKYIVETTPEPIMIYNSLEALSEVWTRLALDGYCECLKKAGVACTS
jgi:hypothetical protein